ncbi:hypothetical protein D3C85_941840 [compost metagenome]
MEQGRVPSIFFSFRIASGDDRASFIAIIRDGVAVETVRFILDHFADILAIGHR